jgi:prepilin-type N-terminal cleavage/methylation domain-containing protein
LRHPRLTNKGFSLLELILALAIVGLLAGAVGTFSLAWQARTYSGYTEAQLYNDFRYALNYISFYVRLASRIDKGSFGSYTLHFPDNSSLRSFKIGRQTYQRTLWVKEDTLPICSHVAAFEIDTSEPPLATIRITSVNQIPGIGRGLPITITRQVRMRNYGR